MRSTLSHVPRTLLLVGLVLGCQTRPVPDRVRPGVQPINLRETGFEVFVPADQLLTYASEAMVSQGVMISERTPSQVSGTLRAGSTVVVSTKTEGPKTTVRISASILGVGDSASAELEALIGEIVDGIHGQIRGR